MMAEYSDVYTANAFTRIAMLEDENLRLKRQIKEYQDKIEQGLMIELGYHIRKSYRNHDDQRYKIVIVEENDIDKIGYDCLTREEAEAKLKELQE